MDMFKCDIPEVPMEYVICKEGTEHTRSEGLTKVTFSIKKMHHSIRSTGFDVSSATLLQVSSVGLLLPPFVSGDSSQMQQAPDIANNLRVLSHLGISGSVKLTAFL